MSFTSIREQKISKACTRFSSVPISLDERKAIVYVKLRNDGCDKGAAKRFVCRPVCRNDITREKDGPIGCRTLRIRKPSSDLGSGGWCIFDTEYDLGNGLHLSKKELLIDDNDEKIFRDHYYKQEIKIKEDYRKKVIEIYKYFDELSKETKLTGLERTELLEKLNKEKMKSTGPQAKRAKLKLQDLQFKTPAVNLQEVDDELIDALDLEAEQTEHIRSQPKESDEPESAESPQAKKNSESLAANNIGVPATNQTPLIQLESIAETVEDSVDQGIDSEKKLKSEQKPKYEQKLNVDDVISGAFREGDNQKGYGTLMKEVQSQMKSINKILEQDPSNYSSNAERRKKAGLSPVIPPLTLNVPRKGSIMMNLARNKEFAKEFNKVNYLFGVDEDAEKRFALSPTSISKKSRFSSSPSAKSKISSTRASSRKNSLSTPGSTQKEYERYKAWQSKPSPEINLDSLTRKRKEMDEIVQKYREKVKPLKRLAPRIHHISKTSRNSPLTSARSSSIGSITSVYNTTPAQTARSFFPSKKFLLEKNM